MDNINLKQLVRDIINNEQTIPSETDILYTARLILDVKGYNEISDAELIYAIRSVLKNKVIQ